MARERKDVYAALMGNGDKSTGGIQPAADPVPGTESPAGTSGKSTGGMHAISDAEIAAAIISSPDYRETRGRHRMYDANKPPKTKGIPDGWERQSYILKSDVVEALKALAWYTPGLTIKDLATRALETYIKEKVDPDTLEKALEGYRNRKDVKAW